MTLDEHIQKAEEDAKMAEFDTEWGIGKYFIDRTEALQHAKFCRQLAEWLKDYKRLLGQQPCDDAISRRAVLEAIDVKACEFCDYLIRNGRNDEQKPVSHFADNLRECVGEDLPPVTPQPKMGRWKAFTHSAYHGNDEDGEPIWREVTVYHCDLCNRRTVIKEKYCPNCGHRMQEVEE